MVKVKICGITNAEDGFAAIGMGADYIGFVVEIAGSERSLGRRETALLVEQLRGKAKTVVLTSLAGGREIAGLCSAILPAAVQLVRDLPEEEIFLLHHLVPKLIIMKTIPVKKGANSLAEAKRFEKFIDFAVLDGAAKGKFGGTGKKADWKSCREIAEQLRRPVFLAGGLAPGNVRKAIAAVKPYGVDVSSGVKMDNDKRKIDKEKLRKFIEGAKA